MTTTTTTITTTTTRVSSSLIPAQPEKLDSSPPEHLNLTDLEKNGFAPNFLNSLKENFRKEINDYAPDNTCPFYPLLNESFNELFSSLEVFSTLVKKGHTLKNNGHWHKLSPAESLAWILYHLSSIDGLLFLNKPDAPLHFYSQQLADFFVTLYCKKQNLESSKYLAIPFAANLSNAYARVICVKEKGEWVTTLLTKAGTKNMLQHEPVELSPGRSLIVDTNYLPIDRALISAYFQQEVIDETNYYKEMSQQTSSDPIIGQALSTLFNQNNSDPMIRLTLVYYKGAPKDNDEMNALTVDVTFNSTQTIIAKPRVLEDPRMIAQAQEYANVVLESMRDEVCKRIKDDRTQHPVFSFFLPNSEIECKNLERQLLEEIAKNPEEHIEMIQWFVDTAFPALPSTEQKEPGEEWIPAQEAITLLLDAYPALEEPLLPLKMDERLLQEDAKRKKTIEEGVWVKSEAASKKAKPSNKKQKKQEAKQQKPTAEKVASKNSLTLTSEERGQVRHVMQGNAMKGHEFNKFVLTLTKRKVQSLNVRRKGSHINTGQQQSLVRIHRNGRKDLQGVVAHQKSILRDLLKSE